MIDHVTNDRTVVNALDGQSVCMDFSLPKSWRNVGDKNTAELKKMQATRALLKRSVWKGKQVVAAFLNPQFLTGLSL